MRKKYTSPQTTGIQLQAERFLAASLPISSGGGEGGSGGYVKDDSDWATRRKRTGDYNSALWKE